MTDADTAGGREGQRAPRTRGRLPAVDRDGRTLAYGLLTLLLGGGYAVVVQPARRRIQAMVDRRFNRRRHDAAQTIEAFSVRLREQVDLDTLTAELLAVVEQTMQPTQASLWLRLQPSSGTAGARLAVRRT